MRDLLTLAVIALPIAGVYLLPPDTSLDELKKSGVLTACVPSSYPPLVTGKADAPGYDIALLQEFATRLDLRLSLNINALMGKDFNLRNWGVNRAQCQLLAGGIVASNSTRSFVDTIDTRIQTGWTLVQTAAAPIARGAVVGVYPGTGGLDRVGLTSFLRQYGVRAVLVTSASALAGRIATGELAGGITESLGAGALLAANPGWSVQWMPESLGRYPLSFGLWKGDLTLKRELTGILDDLARTGVLDSLKASYGIASPEASAVFAD